MKMPVPLTPREVKEARLLPYECLNRWGFFPRENMSSVTELPQQVQHEFRAAQAAWAESAERGTLREDYPQAFELDTFSDLVHVDGLTVHEWQL